jgi:hypothetical protein
LLAQYASNHSVRRQFVRLAEQPDVHLRSWCAVVARQHRIQSKEFVDASAYVLQGEKSCAESASSSQSVDMASLQIGRKTRQSFASP